MTSSGFVTILELAAMAGVPRWVIRRRIAKLGVPLIPSPHDRRQWLIRRSDIEALLNVDAALARREAAA